jgi:aspartyl-tRNA(Asn)/glutamyl-tRNA(Gln) amidotransferase subunit A
MSNELMVRPLAELAPLLEKKELSPVELVQEALQRIEKYDPQLNSYITVLSEAALKTARQAEREILDGQYRGPLHGIPLSIKDLFATKGVRTTAGSRVLENWIPDHDATAVERWRDAGAIILGKTNTHEFAYGVTTDNPGTRRRCRVVRAAARARPWLLPYARLLLVPTPEALFAFLRRSVGL